MPSQEWSFVVTSRPSDFQERKIKRTVRSHVTRLQHKALRHRLASKKRAKTNKQVIKPKNEIDEQKELAKQICHKPCVLLDASCEDPFNTMPVEEFQSWFTWLSDYWYKGTMPRSAKLLMVTPDQIQLYNTWSRQLEITEPALYYMSLLLASGIPVANGTFPLVKALYLRGQTIKYMNEALDDPERATSNALIMAVGQLALHEHIYGDRSHSLSTHRPAQQRMIALRGGIEKMGLPTITVQVMVWYDKLMAAETGTTPYFAAVPGRLAGVKAYNDDEAIRVTNTSSPKRHAHPGYELPAS